MGIFLNGDAIVSSSARCRSSKMTCMDRYRFAMGNFNVTTDTLLAVVNPAYLCEPLGRWPSCIRGSAARQMDEFIWRASFHGPLPDPDQTGLPSHSLTLEPALILETVLKHYAADGAAAIGLRYFSSRVSIAHNARAVLWATATAVTLAGLRAASACSHGRGVTFLRRSVPTSLLRHGLEAPADIGPLLYGSVRSALFSRLHASLGSIQARPRNAAPTGTDDHFSQLQR